MIRKWKVFSIVHTNLRLSGFVMCCVGVGRANIYPFADFGWSHMHSRARLHNSKQHQKRFSVSAMLCAGIAPKSHC